MKQLTEARRRSRRQIRAGLGACALAVAGCFLAAVSLGGSDVQAASTEVAR